MSLDRYKKYDVIILGAGPAGLAAAIESSRRGLSCLLTDRNKKPGRKLYASGNGHCNICNEYYDASCYYDSEFAKHILVEYDLKNFTLDYLESLGVRSVSKNGYYYPMSMQASTVVWALRDAAVMSGAEIMCDSEVVSIYDDGDLYIAELKNGEKICASALIIATGSPSQPDLGAADSDSIIRLFDGLKLEYEPFRASLCPLRCNESFEMIAGVRCDAEISVGDTDFRERGELQITGNTLSGIVIFNLSEYMMRYRKEYGASVIHINLLSDISDESFIGSFLEMKERQPDRRLLAFLNGYINDKLAAYFINKLCTDKVIPDDKLLVKDVSENAADEIYKYLTDWKVIAEDGYGYDRSQASAGGIKTENIDPEDMHIIGRRELYAAGEATDVLGKCGGYNISYALLTGYLAGRGCLKNNGGTP